MIGKTVAICVLVLTCFTASAPLVAQRAPADPELPDRSVPVSRHVHVVPGFPNVGIVVGTRGVLVVDTGLGKPIGERVATEARRLAPGEKLYLTTTHFHPEHAAGQAGFPVGTTVIRSKVQQVELERDGPAMVKMFASRGGSWGKLLEAPVQTKSDVLFDKSYRLDLGGVTVKMYAVGPGHTEGDEAIYVVEDRLVFPGDLVEQLHVPSFTCATCTPRSWVQALDSLDRLKVDKFVPTHGPYLIDRSWIGQERRFLTQLQHLTDVQKSQGKTAKEAAPLVKAGLTRDFGNWQGLDTGILHAVEQAYRDN